MKVIQSSPSTRKVWIEIDNGVFDNVEMQCHLPHGRCGLKYTNAFNGKYTGGSPSTRKVWIEIKAVNGRTTYRSSHLPHGRCGLKCDKFGRKGHFKISHLPHGRCGLKFAVKDECLSWFLQSPSTRKVWIEIIYILVYFSYTKGSPSTRKVWIEIQALSLPQNTAVVTFHTEGVD